MSNIHILEILAEIKNRELILLQTNQILNSEVLAAQVNILNEMADFIQKKYFAKD